MEPSMSRYGSIGATKAMLILHHQQVFPLSEFNMEDLLVYMCRLSDA
ncbi:hypothetical protein OK016_16640 [Vibrio chagasii]|nr:hypothetical protein [Vibrio chagasii]